MPVDQDVYELDISELAQGRVGRRDTAAKLTAQVRVGRKDTTAKLTAQGGWAGGTLQPSSQLR